MSESLEFEEFVVNSQESQIDFACLTGKLWDKHKYLVWKMPKIGPVRSLSQNGLFHMWARTYAAHLLNKTEKEISEGELEGMKRIAKKKFYQANRKEWAIVQIVDPHTGNKRLDFRSSKKYSTHQMWEFLFWLQLTAAMDGCHLEASGEFKRLFDQNAGG